MAGRGEGEVQELDSSVVPCASLHSADNAQKTGGAECQALLDLYTDVLCSHGPGHTSKPPSFMNSNHWSVPYF